MSDFIRIHLADANAFNCKAVLFRIIQELPEIGYVDDESAIQETVTAIRKLHADIDAIHHNKRAFDYDLYEIESIDDFGEAHYLCVAIEKPESEHESIYR